MGKIENKKVLLFDLDDTLYDFSKGETESITYLFNHYQIPVNETNIKNYKKINVGYWEKLERKEMTKEEILVGRFRDFFTSLGLNYDPKEANKLFLDYLSHEAYYVEDALKVLKELKQRGYLIYLISNGIEYVQKGRLAKEPELLNYLDKVYLSDCINLTKPDPRFVDYIIDETGLHKEDAIIIGDSLTSDMKLGFNTGIDTIWFNKKEKINQGQKPNYEIHSLMELLELL